MRKNNALIGALLLGVAICGSPAFAAPSKKAKKAEEQIEAPIPGVVSVSTFEYNTFVLPVGIKRIFFPAGSPVLGKPVYLADNTQVMLQFAKPEKGAKPIQMVVELDNEEVVTLRLQPRDVPGVTHSVNGARPKIKRTQASGPAVAPSEAPRGEDIELLKQVVSHKEPPSGYEAIELPAATRFDKFTVVPLAGWSDGASKRILIFSLVAVPGQTAVVAPPQFYRPGITAVMLNGDVVDEQTSPQLFVVEELNDE